MDIVDQHLLREDGRGVGVTRPVATDREVQDDEERMIEDPGVALDVGRGLGRVEGSVDVPADGIGFPLDGEDVAVFEFRR